MVSQNTQHLFKVSDIFSPEVKFHPLWSPCLKRNRRKDGEKCPKNGKNGNAGRQKLRRQYFMVHTRFTNTEGSAVQYISSCTHSQDRRIVGIKLRVNFIGYGQGHVTLGHTKNRGGREKVWKSPTTMPRCRRRCPSPSLSLSSHIDGHNSLPDFIASLMSVSSFSRSPRPQERCASI
jgi:hypothetical protein